jgi:hypothetical protein
VCRKTALVITLVLLYGQVIDEKPLTFYHPQPLCESEWGVKNRGSPPPSHRSDSHGTHWNYYFQGDFPIRGGGGGLWTLTSQLVARNVFVLIDLIWHPFVQKLQDYTEFFSEKKFGTQVSAIQTLSHTQKNWVSTCVTSGFCRGVNGIFFLLWCYAAWIGSQLRTFQTTLEDGTR